MIARIDRRLAILGVAGLAAGTAMSAHAAADPLSGDALYADVKTYAELGEHRTGTPGDAATTKWLARALKAAGYDVEVQGFGYPVFELERCEIDLGGQALESFPYWTPLGTPAAGLMAPLSADGGPGKVALVILPAGSGSGLYAPPPSQIATAVDSGAAAVIVVTQNSLGQLAALNRNPRAPPWKVPVVLAAGRDEAALKAAASSGGTVTVRLEGRTIAGRAENVVARRRKKRGAHIVVTTPKSGWFHCAGERGSGIAIWLGLARWLARSDINAVLLAASGHEFDGYGGKYFTETLAPKPADTDLWVHIGANVASYDFAMHDGRIVRQPGPPTQRLLAVSEPLMISAGQCFAGQPGYEQPFDIDKRKAPGEVAHFQELGYAPIVGMVGSHPLHHTRRDLADVTGPEVLAPVARGLALLIAQAT